MSATEVVNFERLTWLINERRLLHSKLLSLEIDSHENSRPKCDVSTEDEEELLTRISKAKSDLIQIKTDKLIQETLLQSLQLNYAIANTVLNTKNEEEDEDMAKHKRCLMDLITKQNKLTLKFIAGSQNLDSLQDRFDELQKCCRELIDKKQTLLKEIENVSQQTERREDKTRNSFRLKSHIKEKMNFIGVLQQVFQKLIHASEIQWSDSAEVQKLLDVFDANHLLLK